MQDNNPRSKGLPTGYAGSSPPGPMIYWLGRRGGTPWDRLGGALPVEEMTAATIMSIIQSSKCVCMYIPEEDSSVVLGTERLDVAVAPLEPSPSAVLTGAAEE